MKTPRQANYDLLRILSTIAVILIHINWHYFGSFYNQPQNNLAWVWGAFINIIARFSVPSFVMLSGAFILQNEKNRDAVFFYKKSLLKIFLPTLAVLLFLILGRTLNSIIYYDNAILFLSGFKGILTGGFYNLWYMSMLAGLYLLVPLLIRIKQSISWKKYRSIAIFMMVWAVISQATSSQKLAYSIGVVFAYLGYFMMGDVLCRESNIAPPPPDRPKT